MALRNVRTLVILGIRDERNCFTTYIAAVGAVFAVVGVVLVVAGAGLASSSPSNRLCMSSQ